MVVINSQVESLAVVDDLLLEFFPEGVNRIVVDFICEVPIQLLAEEVVSIMDWHAVRELPGGVPIWSVQLRCRAYGRCAVATMNGIQDLCCLEVCNIFQIVPNWLNHMNRIAVRSYAARQGEMWMYVRHACYAQWLEYRMQLGIVPNLIGFQ